MFSRMISNLIFFFGCRAEIIHSLKPPSESERSSQEKALYFAFMILGRRTLDAVRRAHWIGCSLLESCSLLSHRYQEHTHEAGWSKQPIIVTYLLSSITWGQHYSIQKSNDLRFLRTQRNLPVHKTRLCVCPPCPRCSGFHSAIITKNIRRSVFYKSVNVFLVRRWARVKLRC